MRKLILLGALTTVLLGVSASGASATTWSGTCHMEGKTRFLDSPLTFRLEHHDFVIAGKGSCTGTLNGAPYDGPASHSMDGRMNTPMSCEAGTSNDVPGAITFGTDPSAIGATKVGLTIGHVHIASEAPFYMVGDYNGTGWGLIQFQGGQALLEACAAAGATEIPYVLDAHTITPLYG